MNGDGIALSKELEASPTIKVEIYDQAYTVRSDGDPEYLKQLAEYVDQRMREISSGTLTVDSRKVAILAALYIADELHQLRKAPSAYPSFHQPHSAATTACRGCQDETDARREALRP